MLPALQKEETTWPELRSMGVGWWLRSIHKLRRCIEKVRQPVALPQYHQQFKSVQSFNCSSVLFLYAAFCNSMKRK